MASGCMPGSVPPRQLRPDAASPLPETGRQHPWPAIANSRMGWHSPASENLSCLGCWYLKRVTAPGTGSPKMLLQREMVCFIQFCAWIGASFCSNRAAAVVELQHMAHGGMPDGVICPQARSVAVSPGPETGGQCPWLPTGTSMLRHVCSGRDVVSWRAGCAGVATHLPKMLPKCCCGRKWHRSFKSLLGLGRLSSLMMLELLRTSSTWRVAACLAVSPVDSYAQTRHHRCQKPVVSTLGPRLQTAEWDGTPLPVKTLAVLDVGISRGLLHLARVVPKCSCSGKWFVSFSSVLGLGPLSAAIVLQLLSNSSTWHMAACLTVSSVHRHDRLPSHLAQRPVVSSCVKRVGIMSFCPAGCDLVLLPGGFPAAEQVPERD